MNSSQSIDPKDSRARFGLALCAVALPPLLAYNLTPSATLFNQLLSLGGWGLALLVWGHQDRPVVTRRPNPALWALLALLLAGPGLAALNGHVPLSVTLNSGALVVAALAVLALAQRVNGEARQQAANALFWGLLATGLISAGISVLQVFTPQWIDGTVIARSGIPGRAVGNLRQPNHLASLLMWAAVAAVYLAERPSAQKRWRGELAAVLFACVFAVVLSASRTGYIGVGLLALWGLLDRRLSRSARLALLATPLMGLASWGLMWVWAQSGQHAFGAASRLAEGAGSPARLAIIANAWDLIKANPLLGVGWGEFNFAWSLSPFPDRPIAFFDHTHNLPVQLAVELGLPVAGLILALLGWALAQAVIRARLALLAAGLAVSLLGVTLWREHRLSMAMLALAMSLPVGFLLRAALKTRVTPPDEAADNLIRRCALMLVLMIGLHSLLEYPLWYAYFLLPAVFALGLALPMEGRSSTTSLVRWFNRGIGAALTLGSLFAVWDYSRIVAIYAPSADAAPLTARIAVGQRSPLFGHHADYAAATSLPPGPEALAAARRTAFSLVDARLLMQWSKSLEATGDAASARFLADRLREFHNASTDDWFAECDPGEGEAPYQCQPAQALIDWRTLR